MSKKLDGSLNDNRTSPAKMTEEPTGPGKSSSVSQEDSPMLGFAFQVSACIIIALALAGSPECVHGFPNTSKKDKGGKSTTKEEKQPTAEEMAGIEDEIVRLTNAVRKRNGLGPVTSSRALVYLARHHSRDMCTTGSFTHESDAFPKGWKRFMERMKVIGLKDGGENIAFRTWMHDRKKWALAIVKGWVHSPPHLKNILDPAFRYVGVGVRPCGGNIGYVTQVFSTAQGKLPAVRQDRPLPGRGSSSTAILTR